jgi:hypothetical protein
VFLRQPYSSALLKIISRLQNLKSIDGGTGSCASDTAGRSVTWAVPAAHARFWPQGIEWIISMWDDSVSLAGRPAERCRWLHNNIDNPLVVVVDPMGFRWSGEIVCLQLTTFVCSAVKLVSLLPASETLNITRWTRSFSLSFLSNPLFSFIPFWSNNKKKGSVQTSNWNECLGGLRKKMSRMLKKEKVAGTFYLFRLVTFFKSQVERRISLGSRSRSPFKVSTCCCCCCCCCCCV